MQHGARAAKVCGAGGGGCVIVVVEPGAAKRVNQAIAASGGQPMEFRVAHEGITFHPVSAPENAPL